ncbi:MAG: hypothetical protein M1835_007418 [Candelina submexicana]|nr:MAG: hypothetical protein M1835_007418 [Candelina submexicana]
MPMTWNDKADVRLFIHVLKIHSVRLDYPALAAAMGENVTPKALSHRIAKLKAIAAAEETPPSLTTTNAPSPIEKKKATKRTVNGDFKSQSGNKNDDEEGEGDENEEIGVKKDKDDEKGGKGKRVKVEVEKKGSSGGSGAAGRGLGRVAGKKGKGTGKGVKIESNDDDAEDEKNEKIRA